MSANLNAQNSRNGTSLVNGQASSVDNQEASVTRTYRRRWIILVEFSILSIVQGAIWNTWGSITSSAKVVFPGWTDATIALLSNWGNICYLVFLLPVVWLLDTKGLRVATLLASGCTLLGSGIRCFTMEPVAETWLINIGHFLNGVSGIVLFGGPSQVSASWFPPHQRTTATCLIYVVGSLGSALGSLFPPLWVNEVHESSSKAEKDLAAQKILHLMYIQSGCAAALFLCIAFYFPPKPPSPPSISAGIHRSNFKNELRLLKSNKNIWLVGLSYGVSQSVYGCWITVIYINLQVLGIDQQEAGWIGFYSILGGCVTSLLASRIVDFIGGKMKIFLLSGLVLATLCFLYVLGIFLGLFTMTRAALYSTIILGGAFTTGLQPVFIEMAAEVGYPITEGVVGGFLTGLFNVIGTIFLLLFFIPDIGYIWMNWCLIGSTSIIIPLVVLVKENYARLNVDNQIQIPKDIVMEIT